MKFTFAVLAIALVLIAVSPVAAVPPQHQPSVTIQVASGTMTGTSMSTQSVSNGAVSCRNVQQYAEGKMKYTLMSTQGVSNMATRSNNVQQEAVGKMKRTFQSIQDVRNVVLH